MHQSRKIPSALIGLAALLAAACTGPTNEPTTEKSAVATGEIQKVTDPDFEAFLQQMVAEERFSGVALVTRGGQTVHASGYGNATADARNTVDTVFHVASVTKQFTAAAIMQLVEKGLVDLGKSVNEYLPEQYQSPKWQPVSIHHLLSHSSGVPDYAVTRDYYDVVDGFCLGDTVDGMVREAMNKELEFIPGTRFTYSNIGFTLLGLVIEHQSSVPYGDYMAANVLGPMGMSSSRMHVIGHVPSAMEADGYRWSEELGAHAKDEVVTLPVTAPDGGLVTTLEDFVRWADIYMTGTSPILTSESMDSMTTPAVEIPATDSDFEDARGTPQSYGYGLFLGDGLISHSGYIVGFRSHFIIDPGKEILIAVFSNNTTNDPKRISAGLLQLLDSSSD